MGTAIRSDFAGLEISDGGIRLAVDRAADHGHVVHSHRCALPEGAVVSDEIQDIDAVAEALRGLLGTLDATVRRVNLVLGGRRTVCRVEPLTGDDPQRAWAACQERVRRYVVLGGETPAMGRAILPAAPGHDHPGHLISAAAPRSLVARHIDVARRCGLAVGRAEPTVVALARLLLAADGPQPPRFLLFAERTGCEVAILRGEGLVFCYRVPVPQGPDAAEGGWLLAALDRLQDYNLRHDNAQEPIHELVCCGAADGLSQALDPLPGLGIRVAWLDPATFPSVVRLEGGGLDEPLERSAMAPAVASALVDVVGPGVLSGLNLLPPPARKRRSGLLSSCIVVPALITLLATAGLMVWDSFVRREANTLTYLVNHPTPEMIETSRLQRREGLLRQRVAESTLLLESVRHRPVPQILTGLPRAMPSEAWLTRLDITGEGECIIQGKAHADDAVFAFAAALRRDPHVQEVSIGRTGSEREGGLICTRFRLDAALAPPAAPVAEEPTDE